MLITFPFDQTICLANRPSKRFFTPDITLLMLEEYCSLGSSSIDSLGAMLREGR
jgi:hypothetical protein